MTPPRFQQNGRGSFFGDLSITASFPRIIPRAMGAHPLATVHRDMEAAGMPVHSGIWTSKVGDRISRFLSPRISADDQVDGVYPLSLT